MEMVRGPAWDVLKNNVIQPVKSRLRTERTQPLKPGAKSLRGEGFALASVGSLRDEGFALASVLPLNFQSPV